MSEGAPSSPAHHLDARGLLCPLPVIRVQERVEALAAGDTLEVVCTDPGVLHDIPAWCRIHGHRVKTQAQTEDDYILRIEVGVGAR